MKNITIRQLSTLDELQNMQHVEEKVWNMPPIPIHQTYTVLNNGAIILGAFDNSQMIGFLYSFPGFNHLGTYLCSHMLGILKKYRSDGLGMRMKLKQAKIASKMGYAFITWTYDPLESVNAYLNLHKIQAVGMYYLENHYGSLNDDLNHGLPTDRIQVIWNIQNKETSDRIPLDQTKILLEMDNNDYPMFTPMFTDKIIKESDTWFVAIPENFQTIKSKNIDYAKQWRQKTRIVFQRLFQYGFQAIDVIRDTVNKKSFYTFINK